MRKIVVVVLLLVIIAACGVTMYGANAWYFPADAILETLTIPVVGFGIILGIWACTKIPASQPSENYAGHGVVRAHFFAFPFCFGSLLFGALLHWC